MKKLLTRIVGATLGLALAIGVSVGVFSNREAKEVKADPETTTYSFETKTGQTWTAGTRAFTGCDSDVGVNWTISSPSNINNYNSTYKGLQIGTGSKTGSITLSSASAWGAQSSIDTEGFTVITKVELFLNGGANGVASWSASVGGAAMSSSGSQVKNGSPTAWNNGTSKITLTPTTKNTGVFSFTINKSTANASAAYFCGFIVYCSEPEEVVTTDTTTALSVSPATWSGYDTDTLNVSDFTVTCTTSAADDGYVFQGIGHMDGETFVSRVADFSSGNPDVSDTRLYWKAKYPTTENGSTYLYTYVDLTVTEDTVSTVSLSNNLTKSSYSASDYWEAAGLTVTANRLSGKSSNVTENSSFKFYSDAAMTKQANKPIDLGVGEGRIVYVKATYSGISNTSGYAQTVTIRPSVAFVGGTDKGTAGGSGQSDELIKNNVSLASDSCYTTSGAYRFYAGANITISSSAGPISEIDFNMNGDYNSNKISLKAGSSGSYDSTVSTQGVWTGDASVVSFNVPGSSQIRCSSITIVFKQTARDAINDVMTRSTLSYRFIKNAEDSFDYSNVALRFGGVVEKNVWERLHTESSILGYGILFSTDTYLGGDNLKDKFESADGTNVKKYYNEFNPSEDDADLGPKLFEDSSYNGVDGDYYNWNLRRFLPETESKVSIADLKVSYAAVAFIVTQKDGVVFLSETRQSAKTLAASMVSGPTDPAYEGSLAFLANLA